MAKRSSSSHAQQAPSVEPVIDAAAAALGQALAGRGRRAWLVGPSARAALSSACRAPDAPVLLSDATAAERDAVLAEHTGQIELLGDQTLTAALRARGITADAVAVGLDGEVVDPFDGLRHIEGAAIRTITSPDRAFRQNPRLLLAVGRIISWTGFQPTGEIRRYGGRDSGNVLDIPDRNRVWGVEMNALLLGDEIDRALQWLQDTRVLQFIMPEVAAMVGFDKTCPVHHKDIWDHTKKVTQKAARDLVVRWAALCHDIGKVWTRSVNRDGKVHFFRHEEHGALLFESIAHRMALDSELTQRVAYLIQNHSRVNLYRDDWTDSAVRRLVRQTEGHLEDLLTFSKADFTTKRRSRIDAMRRQMTELEERIDTIREADAKQPPLPTGLGDAIMQRFALAPSRAIGDLKRLLEARVEAGDLPERDEEMTTYLDWLASDPDAREQILSAGGQIR